ncbi:cysteine protease domain, YopT-type [Oesophagostomum dentatum]|uniref:RNA methyltransferase n=1 Tax=Oesophagostomum dentatum TaxID=61180 RepID=A0A0B1T3Q1_OESDE|nr:cysteine protease domain, YopT-type [Oesophagostomum dentatum]
MSEEDSKQPVTGHRNIRRVGFRGGRRRFGHEFVYPTGGSKEDPLNLNAVMSGNDAQTAKQAEDEGTKLLEVLVPKNVKDPLNLGGVEKQRKRKKQAGDTSVGEDEIVSPVQRKQKKRHHSHSSPKRDHKDSSSASTANTSLIGDESSASGSKPTPAELRRLRQEHFNNRYCYGNFDRYYGTRLDPGQKDSRLSVLKKEWFEKKSILDIGCNVGFLTLSIAKDFGPRRILGIDIDDHLIGVARKNIRHYCDQDIEFIGKFPASFCTNFGPISNHSLSFSTKFPDNVWFRKENYVLENDELLETVQEEFDVILALSITKWIHLNYGDDGLRRFFRRAYNQLLPGGRFIVEPQPFASYRKRAKMTERLRTNYAAIEFKPEDFEMYLLETVGFESVEHLGAPCAKSKGFERPIDVYLKKPPKFMEREAKGDDET